MLRKLSAMMAVLLALLLFTAAGADAKPKKVQKTRYSSMLVESLGGDASETKFRKIAGHLGLTDRETAELLQSIGDPQIDYSTNQTIYQVVVSKKRVEENYHPVSGDRTEMSFVYRLSTGREVWTVVDSNEFGLRSATKRHQDVTAAVAKSVKVEVRASRSNGDGSTYASVRSQDSQLTTETVIGGSTLTTAEFSRHGEDCNCEICKKRRTGKGEGKGQDHGKDSKKGTFDPFDLTAWAGVHFGEGTADSGKKDEVGYNVGAKTRYYIYQNGPFGAGAWGTIQHGGADNDNGQNSWTKAGGGAALRYKGERIDNKLDLGAVAMWSDFESHQDPFAQNQTSLLGSVSNYTLMDGRRKDGHLVLPDLQVWLTGEAQLAVLDHKRTFDGKRLEDDPQDFGRLDVTAKLGLYDFNFGCDKEYRLTPQLVLGGLHEVQNSRNYLKGGVGLEGAYKSQTVFDFAATYRKALGNGGRNRIPLELAVDVDGVRGLIKSASISQPTAADYDINVRRAKADDAFVAFNVNGDK